MRNTHEESQVKEIKWSQQKISDKDAEVKFDHQQEIMKDITEKSNADKEESQWDAEKVLDELLWEEREPRIWEKIEYLTSEGAAVYALYLWNEKVWSVVKCGETMPWRTSKAMFISAKNWPALFTVSQNGNSYPNIAAIQKYMDDWGKENNKHRVISMITTWPTFDAYNSNTLSWMNYDNWIAVGTETTLTWCTTNWKWILSISWWKLNFSHTQEMSETDLQVLIAKQADIVNLSSLKRNWSINPNGSLWRHPYWHSLVQFNDGSWWEVIINKWTDEEHKKIMEKLPIQRALYADWDAKTNYLDWIWIKTKDWLKYSHPDKWDLFINEKAQSTAPIADNMPWVIIFFAEK